MIAANAIRIPIFRQPVPNPSATRLIASVPTPGVKIDTTKAPSKSPRKACSLSHKIETITTASPTRQISIAPIHPPSVFEPYCSISNLTNRQPEPLRQQSAFPVVSSGSAFFTKPSLPTATPLENEATRFRNARARVIFPSVSITVVRLFILVQLVYAGTSLGKKDQSPNQGQTNEYRFSPRLRLSQRGDRRQKCPLRPNQRSV